MDRKSYGGIGMEEELESYYAIFLYYSYQTYINIAWIEDSDDVSSLLRADYILLSKRKFASEKEAELFLEKFLGRKELPPKVQLAILEYFDMPVPKLEGCLDNVVVE